MPWTFKDWVDGRGENTIRRWLSDQPLKARLKLDAILRHLRLQERLGYPLKKVKGYDGVFEIVVESFKVQYRPLGGYGSQPKTFVLVLGAIEQNDRIQPPDAFASAEQRVGLLNTGAKNTCDHEYENPTISPA